MKLSSFHIILFFFALLFISETQAQTQWLDSVKKVLQTQKADTGKINTLFALNDAYRFSNPDSAVLYGQKALSLAEKLKSDSIIFWSIAAINLPLYVMGNYALELDYCYKALPYAKKLNRPYSTGYLNGMLSDCYYNLGEYNTSMRYWRVVIRLAEQTMPNELFAVYGNSVHIFCGMRQYDSALIYARKSKAIMYSNPYFNKENRDSKLARSNIFTALGDCFEGKAAYDSALFYYKMSLPFSDDTHMEINRVDAFNGIASVYKKTGRYYSAAFYAKKVLAETITKTYPQSFLKAANLLAAVYELQKKADSSLKYLHIAINIKDSLFNREKTTAFQNILFKEREKQKELEAAKLKLQREYRTYFLIAIVIIVLIATAIVIKNKRQKYLQNMRNSIADDLHDDIGSALSSISIMSELAKNEPPKALSLLSSIGDSTVTIQENMSDIVWTIKSGNDRFENVLQRMNQFASEMLEAKEIVLDFKNDAALPASRLTMNQRKNFYLFFKEAVNNAAKYSDADKVSITIVQQNNTVELNIRDDGKGFDTSNVFIGNGMSSLKKRAAELNGDFKIMSEMNEGTTIQLKFKIT